MIIKFLFILFLVNSAFIVIYKKIKLLSILKKIHKINNSIYDISENILSSDNIEDIYTLILEELLKIIKKGSKASFLLYNKRKNVIEYKGVIGYDFKQLKNVSFEMEELYHYGKSKLEKPYIIRNPQQYNNVYLDSNKYNSLINMNALDIKATLSIPIHVDDKFSGMINIDSSESRNVFSKHDLKLSYFIKSEIEKSLKMINLLHKLNTNANYDYLTKTMNIRCFKEKFNEISNNCKCVLILIDLNNFKYINDTFGHHEGNNILKIFSDTVREFIRKDDLFARCGGDEFLILLKDIDLDTAQIRIDEIREALKDVISFGAGMQEITFSENVCLDDVFKVIDKKMYADKKNKPKY
ncbi:sensor domain-containing diguanylate cyclase [Tepidibacter aestuarii]|uniref:sensor domain-containing diguanylate cyclase n=1 Tax=Tepidibacter aestuarii TaxID=2925782 RepID=UPI0020BE5EFA|nr:sensor domain-containing diguanylate cyclase [Tepidibacter aestuarii]CAH2211781.1 putative diguanylate cyclase YdaM [Tepidibacter aestuarii]